MKGMMGDSKFPALHSTVAVIFALLVCASCAFGQAQATEPHTTVTLLANSRTVAPGQTFLMGLQFEMEKGWHVYWQNPGDSGEPPRIQWQLPAGFRAGAIEWPAPKKLVAPSIVDYGYENEVLLMTPVSISGNLRGDATGTISTKVDWLVCREMCIPGKAQLSIALPVKTIRSASEGGTPTAALFREARRRIPTKAPADWKLFAVSEKNDFVLTVETGKPDGVATFFPLDAEQVDNDASQAETPFAQGLRLRLRKSDGLLKPITQLRGVLELSAGRAYEIAALVRAAR